MIPPKMTTHGGPRKGAGRKPTGRKAITVPITLHEEQWDKLNEIRKTYNPVKSQSHMVALLINSEYARK